MLLLYTLNNIFINLDSYTVKNGRYYYTYVSLLGHVSKIVSILLSKLSDCPNYETLLCYYNYLFLTVCKCRWTNVRCPPGSASSIIIFMKYAGYYHCSRD